MIHTMIYPDLEAGDSMCRCIASLYKHPSPEITRYYKGHIYWAPLKCQWLLQWIGLSENLNRKPSIFPSYEFSCKFSLQPIQWMV